MKRFMIIAVAFALGCFFFATPAAAQPWGLGPQISRMARDGVLGRDLADRAHRLQYERSRQWPPGTRNQFQSDRFGQTHSGTPKGKAWGLRGGKPFTGKGHPLNGLPNGRAFQDPSTVCNGLTAPAGGRDRTIRTLPGYDRGGRGFGGGPGRGRGRR